MGALLPKPVDSVLVERHGSTGFNVAVAEMSGWRLNMEDAHLIHVRDDYGVFGVFDGHGGANCSSYVAQRLREELERNGCPQDDASVKKLFLRIDQEFLDSEQSSGTTATMCIVHKPARPGDKHRLHVINAGDSRVLLGKRNGAIVDGNGTDQGLTIDHKPDDPSEYARIVRCGGKVERATGGVARVNGNLAVSRGFGDLQEKRTGGESLEDRPVTANPDMFHLECDDDDFLLLVCDGISEGSFSNSDVVKLVAQYLQDGKEPGQAARAVCQKALECDSKDNLSCMLVLLSGSAAQIHQPLEFIPGSISCLGRKHFRDAFKAVTDKAGISLAEAAAMRYEIMKAEMARSPTDELEEEAAFIGTPDGQDGSQERIKWFENWLENVQRVDQGNDERQGTVSFHDIFGVAPVNFVRESQLSFFKKSGQHIVYCFFAFLTFILAVSSLRNLRSLQKLARVLHEPLIHT